jgi:hypothetical protein
MPNRGSETPIPRPKPYTTPYVGGSMMGQPVSSSPTTWKNVSAPGAANPYLWYTSGYTAGTQPGWPGMTQPMGGGSGGGSGGGGGGSGLTQPYAEAMMKLLGQGPASYSAKQFSAPAYQPYDMPDFDASMYDQMRQRTSQAGEADRAAARGAYANLGNTLASNYQNAYANANYASSPQMQAAMSNMLGAQGNSAVQQRLGVQNNEAAQADAAFGNVLALLAANEDMGQRSRLNQVDMDRNTALRGIDAQLLGVNAGIDRQQGEAKQVYDRESRDRAASDNMTAQEWARQLAMLNWQAEQEAARYNTETKNQFSTSRLQPLIDLLMTMSGSGMALPSIPGM